jgi:hypothetical protein
MITEACHRGRYAETHGATRVAEDVAAIALTTVHGLYLMQLDAEKDGSKLPPTLPLSLWHVSEQSSARDRGLSEACLFIPKGIHLLLLITIVLSTTRRDLVVATERGSYLVRAVHSL